MPKEFALVLDIGTTGVKAIIFKRDRTIVARKERALHKNISEEGVRVEQDPQEMLDASRAVLKEVSGVASLSKENCVGLALTNQRETVIAWDKVTGRSLYPAIVWEDSRTEARCKELFEHAEMVRSLTGLPLESYFSASRLDWLLANVQFDPDNLLVGTVDSWILWNLLKGRPHVTDFTNASRTLLFNIKSLAWDQSLLDLWHIPRAALPEAKHSLSLFGELDESLLGFALPVVAVSGDQQASLFAARESGARTKVTYGTGTFLMHEIGETFALHEGFYTTLSPALDGPVFALEAKVGTYGNRIAALLQRHESLAPVIDEMTSAAALVIDRLPQRPEKIILDGGITQAPTLLSSQSAKSPDIECVLQQPFDGTALGAALMAFASER